MTILNLLLQILIYAGIVQGIYSAMVLTHTRLKNPANHYLAILLIVLSISILHSVFVIPYFHEFHKTSFHVKEPFILLVVPFIWLYVKKLSEPSFRFRKKHLFHFLPFLVVMSFSFFYLMHNTEIKEDRSFYIHTLVLNIILYFVAFCQYLFYLYYMFRLLRSFKAKVLDEVSNTENIDPAWLRIFLITLSIVFLLLIVMMVIAIHRLDAGYFNKVVSLVFALIIYVLGYKGLFQQTILPAGNADVARKDYEVQTIENKDVDKNQLNTLLEFMVTNKPYHEPELTLTSLAEMVNISRNQLSELINSGTGGNFYDFVNKYRVDEVKQLMENPKYKDYTILAIAFEAGFPSKSTFNSIFKKYTGKTPTEYRNEIRVTN